MKFLFLCLALSLFGCQQDKSCAESVHLLQKNEKDFTCPRGTKVNLSNDSGDGTVICRCSTFSF